MTDFSPNSESEDRASWWTPARRKLASILLLFHLAAVFAAPCASPPPASFSWNWLAGRTDGKDGLLSPYLRALYLNHGYRFFAPNPGPAHLVRYEIDLPSGGTVEGEFPDVEEHFPRLLYHRMFMISETAFNLANSVRISPAPGSLTELEQIDFDKQLAASDELARSIARRLLDENKGAAVRLFVRTHEIPFPADVKAGQRLDDPSLFSEFSWRSFSKEQL